VTIGPNMVVNGTFANGLTGWTQLAPPNELDVTREVIGGRFHGAGSSGNRMLYGSGSVITLVAGHTYNWSANVEVISGQVTCGFNAATGMPLTSRGLGIHPVSVSFVSTVSNSTSKPIVNCYNGAAQFFVDNIEVKEILPMALGTTGFKLVVSLIDAGRDQSNLTFDLVAATYADAITASGTILGLLAAVSDGVVKGYSVIEKFVEGALVLPASTVELENRALITCQINNDPLKTATVTIPAGVIGLYQAATGAGHNLIDVNDADLLAYINIWQVTGALAKLSDGEYLDDTAVLISGRRTHRKNSNG